MTPDQKYLKRIAELERKIEYLKPMKVYAGTDDECRRVLEQKVRDLEEKLKEKDAEIKELKKKYKDLNDSLMAELRDPNGTIWEHAKSLQDQLDRYKRMFNRIKSICVGDGTFLTGAHVLEIEKQEGGEQMKVSENTIKAYITKVEVFDGDEFIANLNLFEEKSWEVKIDNQIMSGEQLKRVANILKDLELNEGIYHYCG